MKKYIWITLFLIGAIILSYMIYFSHKKDNEDVKLSENTIKIDDSKNKEIKNNNILQDSWNNESIDDVLQGSWNNEKLVNNFTWENDLKIEVDTWNKEKEETLVVWNLVLKLAKDKTYDDIFDRLGIWYLNKYKVEWKKIYIKKIDSVDYEEEKVNIQQLIQKIWGNIAEVNWFWDKQLFVNLDPYYKKDSISLVESNGKLYYMILPYDKYYEYKKVIKEFLFNK